MKIHTKKMILVYGCLLPVFASAQVKITKGGHVYLGQYLNPENVVSVGVIAPPTGLPSVAPGVGKFNIVSHYRAGLVIDHFEPSAWAVGSICNSDQKMAKHWVSSYNGTHNFFVTAGGTVYSKSSSKIASDSNFKFDVNHIRSPLDKIMALHGVTFRYKPSATCNDCHTDTIKDSANSQPLNYGFIAQEVERVIPELVSSGDGTAKYLELTGIIPILVEGMKTQQHTIDYMQLRIDLLTAQLNKTRQTELSALPDYNTASINNLDPPVIKIKNKPALYQAQPNRFDSETMINYEIGSGINDASIYIYDMNGTQLKQIPLKQLGKGSISIPKNELEAGMYYYTLTAGGQEIDTKKMILTK